MLQEKEFIYVASIYSDELATMIDLEGLKPLRTSNAEEVEAFLTAAEEKITKASNIISRIRAVREMVEGR